MTQDYKHPIAPPPELVQQWLGEQPGSAEQILASKAAQWGSDQELEACVAFVKFHEGESLARDLRKTRRPKPLTLKEQALAAMDEMEIEPCIIESVDVTAAIRAKYGIIRRALEQLDD
jgi:hypothetical protein